METDLGDKEDPRELPAPQGYYEEEIPQLEQQWVPPPPPPQGNWPPPMMVVPPAPQKRDLFTEIDRTTYIIAFVVFILGFFMGKTMQPVILRNA
jgi:hypothetical protein